MSYKLAFLEAALKEWKKLAPNIREQFKKKLAERLKHPRISAAALRGMEDCYKIKLHDLGYRLVYRVDDKQIVVEVIAVGRRDKNAAYKSALQRLH